MATKTKRATKRKQPEANAPVPTRRLYMMIDGKFTEISQAPAERRVSQYPKTPWTIAVHKSQVKSIEEMVRRKSGRTIFHDKWGRPIWNCNRDEVAYLRARDMCNLDPGYSDVAPNRFDQKVDYN